MKNTNGEQNYSQHLEIQRYNDIIVELHKHGLPGYLMSSPEIALLTFNRVMAGTTGNN